MAKNAAPTDERYADEKAKTINRETLPFRDAMEGATKPRIIRGTRKKIICPQICLMNSTPFIPVSGMRRPADMPATMDSTKVAMGVGTNFIKFLY